MTTLEDPTAWEDFRFCRKCSDDTEHRFLEFPSDGVITFECAECGIAGHIEDACQ